MHTAPIMLLEVKSDHILLLTAKANNITNIFLNGNPVDFSQVTNDIKGMVCHGQYYRVEAQGGTLSVITSKSTYTFEL